MKSLVKKVVLRVVLAAAAAGVTVLVNMLPEFHLSPAVAGYVTVVLLAVRDLIHEAAARLGAGEVEIGSAAR